MWSPRGDYIAFTGLIGSKFAIGILKPDGSGERILTEGFHNEGPTFAPNGRVIMFFRDLGTGPVSVHDRHHRPQRIEGTDAELRLRSGLVAAVVVRRVLTHGREKHVLDPIGMGTGLRKDDAPPKERHIFTGS